MNTDAWIGGGRITIREIHRPSVRDRRKTILTYEVILMDESKVRGVRLELNRKQLEHLADTCGEALKYGGGPAASATSETPESKGE